MRLAFLALTALWLAAPAASAQEAVAREAVPVEAVQQAEPAPQPVRQAVPRGSRPQGNNPQTGTAVPRRAVRRSAPPPPPPASPGVVSRNRGRTVIVRPPAVYGYPYSPYYRYAPYRRYYPYGYGSFGLGFLYYDPYRWHPGAAYGSYSYGYRSGYGYGYQRPFSTFSTFSTFDIGELRLDVSPRHAHVYVDGYFGGTVDDFDGAFQAIKLAPGAYRIEIVAPGYDTLTFDVRITPGQKIRYRGELYRQP